MDDDINDMVDMGLKLIIFVDFWDNFKLYGFVFIICFEVYLELLLRWLCFFRGWGI